MSSKIYVYIPKIEVINSQFLIKTQSKHEEDRAMIKHHHIN